MKMLKRIMLFAIAMLAGPAFAQYTPFPNCQIPFFLNSGQVASNGFVYAYASGTLNPQSTYTDATGATMNTNPVQLNASGFPTNAGGQQICIWLASGLSYRIVLQNAAHVQQYLIDGINSSSTVPGALFALNANSVSPSCGSTTNNQVLHVTPFVSPILNTVGKMFHTRFVELMRAGTTSQAFSLELVLTNTSYAPGSCSGPAATYGNLAFSPWATATNIPVYADFTCWVVTADNGTGNGAIGCYGTGSYANVAGSGGTNPTASAGLANGGVPTFLAASGVSLASGTLYLVEVGQFNVANASNSVVSEAAPVWTDN